MVCSAILPVISKQRMNSVLEPSTSPYCGSRVLGLSHTFRLCAYYIHIDGIPTAGDHMKYSVMESFVHRLADGDIVLNITSAWLAASIGHTLTPNTYLKCQVRPVSQHTFMVDDLYLTEAESRVHAMTGKPTMGCKGACLEAVVMCPDLQDHFRSWTPRPSFAAGTTTP